MGTVEGPGEAGIVVEEGALGIAGEEAGTVVEEGALGIVVEVGLAAPLVVGTTEEGAVVVVAEGIVVAESAEAEAEEGAVVMVAGGIVEEVAGVEVAEQALALEGIVAQVVAAGVVGVAVVGIQRAIESPEEVRGEVLEAPEEVQTEAPVQEEDLVGTLSEEHSQEVVPFEEVVVIEAVLVDKVQHPGEGLVELGEEGEFEVEEASDQEKTAPLEELAALEVGS